MVQLSHAASCREGDFLVAFGVDSTAGRMVARVLMWLLLLQPIYVAVGAEIEEPTVDAADAVEEPVASEAAVAEPEPDKETSEQAAVEITDVAAEDVPATVPNDTGEDAADEVAAAVESVKDPTDEPTVSDDVPDEMAATNDVENPLDAMHDDEAEVDESALPADDQPDVPVEDANETNADTDPSANEGSADIDVGTDVPPATHDEGGGGSRSSGGDEEEDVADDTAPLEDDADMRWFVRNVWIFRYKKTHSVCGDHHHQCDPKKSDNKPRTAVRGYFYQRHRSGERSVSAGGKRIRAGNKQNYRYYAGSAQRSQAAEGKESLEIRY